MKNESATFLTGSPLGWGIVAWCMVLLACNPHESFPVTGVFDGNGENYVDWPESRLNWVKAGTFSARYADDVGIGHPDAALVEGMAVSVDAGALYVLGTMTEGNLMFDAEDDLVCDAAQGCFFLLKYNASQTDSPKRNWAQVLARPEITDGSRDIFQKPTGISATPDGNAMFMSIFERPPGFAVSDTPDVPANALQMDSLYASVFGPGRESLGDWKLVEQLYGTVAPFFLFDDATFAITGIASYSVKKDESGLARNSDILFGVNENVSMAYHGFPTAFVGMFDASGKAHNVKRFDWQTDYRGLHPMDIVGTRVALDNNSDDMKKRVTVAGYFDGAPTELDLVTAEEDDLFLAQFDEDGNVVWTYSISGRYDDRAMALAATEEGDILMTGFLGGTATLHRYFRGDENEEDDEDEDPEIRCEKGYMEEPPGCQIVAKFSGLNGKMLWYHALNPINTGDFRIFGNRNISFGVDIAAARDGSAVVLGMEASLDYLDALDERIVSPWDISEDELSLNVYMARYAGDSDGKMLGTRQVFGTIAAIGTFIPPTVSMLSPDTVLVAGSFVDDVILEERTLVERILGDADHGSVFIASYSTDWELPEKYEIDAGNCFEDCSPVAIQRQACQTRVEKCRKDEDTGCAKLFDCRSKECCNDGDSCLQGDKWMACFNDCIQKNDISAEAYLMYLDIDRCVACNTCERTCAGEQARHFPLCADGETLNDTDKPCVQEEIEQDTEGRFGNQQVACFSWAGWGGAEDTEGPQDCVKERFDCDKNPDCLALRNHMSNLEIQQNGSFSPWTDTDYVAADIEVQRLFVDFVDCIYCDVCDEACRTRGGVYCGDDQPEF